jgi:hypothetical protein
MFRDRQKLQPEIWGCNDHVSEELVSLDNVMPYSLPEIYKYFWETLKSGVYGSSRVFRNVGKLQPDYTASISDYSRLKEITIHKRQVALLNFIYYSFTVLSIYFILLFLSFSYITILERANLTRKLKFQRAFLPILSILTYFLWNPTIHDKCWNTYNCDHR